MERSAIISDCGQYRYKLARIWQPDLPIVGFIGLNPSTADGTFDDPTIRRLINFSYQWGYGGFLIGNLFAWRDKSPAYMKMASDPIGPQNDLHLLELKERCERIVFIWGNNGSFLNRDKQVEAMFPDAFCLKKTKDGYPAHPLYLAKSTQLIAFKQKEA